MKEGQEGSASLAVQPLEPQFQLIVGTIVTLFDEDVEMTEDTPFTSWIPYFPARYSRGLQETVEGSASLAVQLAPRKKKDHPLESDVELTAETFVTCFDQDVEMTEDTPFTSWIPYFPASRLRGLQETVEGFSRHDHTIAANPAPGQHHTTPSGKDDANYDAPPGPLPIPRDSDPQLVGAFFFEQ